MIKKYLNKITNTCSIFSIIQLSIIISIIAYMAEFCTLDKIVEKIPIYLKHPILYVFFAIIVILQIIKSGFYKLFFISVINITDISSIIILVSITFYSFLKFCIAKEFNITSIFLIIAIIIYLIIRSVRCAVYNTDDVTLCDLKDIYNNNIDNIPGPILVKEEYVNYDLLNRNRVINRIHTTINAVAASGSFVIALEGEWGSGKTTIINNVKKDLSREQKYIIIDNIDPWIYGSPEVLLSEMYDVIIKKSGIRYSKLRTKRITRQLLATISNKFNANELVDLLTSALSENYTIESTKKQIEETLKSINKSIVFFVDNIDRASAENVIFLFKVISLIFNISNIVFVLSYDKTRIDNILENTLDIDRNYLEKIIQQEVKIPKIGREQKTHLFTTCLKNILSKYANDINIYDELISHITAQFKDIRQLKRYINTVLPPVLLDSNYLSKVDLLAIESIRFLCPELYEKIYTNRKFFVCYDTIHDSEIFVYNRENFNADAKTFFNELFAQYPMYLELVSLLFPYVRNYKKNFTISYSYDYDYSEYSEAAKNSRICSAKYFDLYYCYGENDYTSVKWKITEFVDSINKNSSYQKHIAELLSLSPYAQKEWTDMLQLFLVDVEQNRKITLIDILLNIIDDIDDSPMFMQVNARDRIIYIISELLQQCTFEQSKQRIEVLIKDYKNLSIMENLTRFANKKDIYDKNIANEYMCFIEDAYNNMCLAILNNNINLYSNENYKQKNVWCIYRYIKNNSYQNADFTDFILSCLNKENVYRVIYDYVFLEHGTQYLYAINPELFIGIEAKVDEIVAHRQPKTNDEEFVHNLYYIYKRNTLNEENRGVTLNNSIHLNL